ncbi:hypothetical protein [Fluviicola sp.]|uniref:hypothetical protein n=1 Tax=Fluviicola sp. TaxID=1917219 RepID=UPI0031E07B02
MNQKLFILCLLIIPFFGLSRGKESLPSYWIIKDSVSSKIHPDSVRCVFRVEDSYGQLMLDQHPVIVQVKIDGKTKKFTVTQKKPVFKLSLSKGKHRVSFFVNANFDEIHLEREFTGKHYYEIGLNFKGSASSGSQIKVEKPVIYLYSEKEESFQLKIKTDAALKFTYPVYTDEWEGTSSANGTIRLNGSSYPYLFWDAILPSEKLIPNWNRADQFKGSDAVTYLENQLTGLGFNENEKTDFITYWGPRMQHMKVVQIIWVQNEGIDPLASLEITPTYKQNRIYILFRETNEFQEQTLEVKVPALKRMDRTGNYLVEWGGMELETNL